MTERNKFKVVTFLSVMVITSVPTFADNCCSMPVAKAKMSETRNIKTPAVKTSQYETLMQAKIYLDSPSAILARTQALSLTAEQKLKLLEIERQARERALAVLTPEQQQKIGNVSATPISIASLFQNLYGKTIAGLPGKIQTQTAQQIVCPVMGGKINKNIFTTYKDKKVYFCCAGCETPFLKNPEKYLSKLPQFNN